MHDREPLRIIDIGAGPACGPEGCDPVGSAVTTQFAVDGMTCSHCVSAVTTELSAVPGVEAVTVSLVPGGRSTVTVGSAAEVDLEAVRAAIDEAGYRLAP